MDSPRRSVSFLAALSEAKFGTLLWPEGAVAIVLGLGGGTAVLHSLPVTDRIGLVGDGLVILGVLLGVVFAGFAFIAALFSDAYLRLLSKADGGVLAFLRPFMIAIGTQVTTVFLTMAYRAAAADVDSRIEVALFLTWAFLFTFAIADVVALTRTVMMHVVTRARLVEVSDEATVTPLRGERAKP